jgi:DNA-binding NarL/FixJ family response regulator
MPGMSGFELLTQVHCRFPELRTIAMSGAFSGDDVPSGVAADSFYRKGSGVASLLRMLETLPSGQRVPELQSAQAFPTPASGATQTTCCWGQEREI